MIHYFYFFIILLSNFQGTNLKNIKQSLSVAAPTYEEILTINLTSKMNDQDLKDFPFENDIQNLQTLGIQIAFGDNLIGTGHSSLVFQFFGNDNFYSNGKVKLTAKEVKVNNDYATEIGKREQDLFEAQLVINQNLNRLDPNRLYFPVYHGAFNVSEFFPIFVNKNINPLVENALTTSDSEDLYVIFTEYLDFDLIDYIKSVDNYNVICFMQTRLQMAESIATAVKVMSEKYYHCDIKPENLMFKLLSDEETEEMRRFGIEPLELHPGKFFKVKLIDFDVSASGNKRDRECNGGTKGYYPLDLHSFPHDKVDVFSVAVTLFNMELAERGYGFYSEAEREIYIAATQNSDLKFSPESIELLKKLPLFELIKTVAVIDGIKDQLLQEIRRNTEPFKSVLTDQQIFNEPIENYVFTDARIFKIILKSTLKLYWKKLYGMLEVPQDSSIYDRFISSLMQQSREFTDKTSQEYLKNEDLIIFFKTRKKLALNEINFRVELVNYYMDIIFSPYDHRDTIEDFLLKIKIIKKSYEDNNKKEIDLITNFSRKYASDVKLDNKFIKRTLDYSSIFDNIENKKEKTKHMLI